MTVEFGLLGPLAVWDDAGRQVSIRGRRPRELLAILLLEPNHAVGAMRIINELWGQQPPKTARESVQVFVHQLRDVLPRRSPQSRFEVLKTHRSSYLLRVDPTQIDVGRFELLVQQAASARQQGDRPTAWARYGEALGLWRGEALADLNDAPFAVVARARLEHHRLSAHEARLEVGLELGWHAELVGELEGLVCEHPHQEGLRALLMRALYRSGRQAEALDAYRAARQVLVEKHGMEPGAPLQQLQRAILAHDPGLEFGPQGAPGQSAPADGVRPQANPSRRSAAAAAGSPAPSSAARPTTPPSSPPRVQERRLVTALVVGVAQGVAAAAGAGGDPEDVHAQTTVWQQAAGERIRHYGGVVHSVVMGRLLAVFGAQRSRADDPERAVRAALEITTSPEGSRLRAGVVTGEALISVRRPPSDAVPVVDGDAPNGAGELQAQAPVGTVLVGAATYGATRRVIAYRPSGTQPETWQALGPAARTGASLNEQPRSPLVERNRELRILRGVLGRCLGDRRPQLVTLVSAPGLGKTRLVGELARLTDALPELVTWRTGQCLPDRAGSLGALAEVVKAHAGILDTDAADRVASKLGRAVAYVIADPDETAQVASQLHVLLGPGPAGPSLDAPADVASGWIRFLSAAAADRPMVMVIEDLHWADTALLTFLSTLTDQVGPVPLLVVCTARTEWFERNPGWGGGMRDAATLSLSRLSRSGAEELLDALLDAEDLRLPATARQAVATAADGNPLYVEEYVRMLRDGSADPAVLARRGGQVPVPLSVEQLLSARIDTLDPDDRQMLRDAAVIGQTGWVGALAAVSGQEPQWVREWLGRLERGGFVRRLRASTVAGETEYAFRHPLIGEVAYRQLVRAERAARHQRAAAWIQGLRADPGERVELVAHHYRQALTLTQAVGMPTAGLRDQTRLALRAAGQQAMRQSALGSAASSFRQALELWPPQDSGYPWVQVELAAAQAYSCQTGHELLQAALASFRRRGDVHGVATAQGLLALLARAEAHPGQAAELTGQADAADLTQDRVDALIGRAAGLLIADRHAEADQTARQAGAAAGRLGLAGQAATARSLSARAAILAGTPDAARDAEQALAAMDLHQVPVRLLSRFSYAHARWWAGELAVCAAAVSAGRAATAAAGAPGPAVRIDAVDAGLAYAAGDWARARALAERVLAADQASYLHPWALVLRGRMDLAAGMLDAAGRAAAEAVTQTHAAMVNTTAELGEVRYGQVAMALAGRVWLAAGDHAHAAKLADELLDWLGHQPARGCATPDLGWLLADLHPPASVSLPTGLPPTHWHAAVIALAARDLTTAAARFVALGSVVDAAEVRLRRAERHAVSGHPGVAQDARDALRVFRRSGAWALVRRAEALGILAPPALCPPSTRTGGRRLHEMTTSS